ncbi:unnamed protein product [Dibothriocephalus latus]|uniref:Uncharacterized protein n=1 Tax=Dibothriocephalus latus TaxID=60516 RepID=A0A3P6QQ47_DIBLA|nr:unnamed protein product [Dibothriocephalus latus]
MMMMMMMMMMTRKMANTIARTTSVIKIMTIKMMVMGRGIGSGIFWIC